MKRIKSIRPGDDGAAQRARERWNGVAKPIHGLGLLEDAVTKIAAIYGSESFDLDSRTAVVLCADNGVTAEGVTQSGSEVTAIVAAALAAGTSSINVMARTFGTNVLPVDIGMNSPVPGVLDRRIRAGTGNIALGPAMTEAQASAAVSVGMDLVRDLKRQGCKIIVAGEMGIGNTTTAAALASALLDLPPEVTAGRGAGLDDGGLRRKVSAIRRALSVNRPDKADPMGLLAGPGGLDIAGMAGLFLGGAVYRLPVIIDGLISAAAAVIAAEIEPMAKDFMLCSHVSGEPAGRPLLARLGLKPIITAELALGEGTGGILLLPLLDGALAVYNSAHRFEDLNMERYVNYDDTDNRRQ